MVNISGRSKGCSTCRRRKVKCDENRPVCNRCQLHNLTCDGPRSTVFIVSTIVKSRRKVASAKRHNSPVLTLAPPKSKTDPVIKNSSSPSSFQTTALVKRPPSISPTPTPPPPQDPLILSICYSRTHLRRGAAIDLALDNTALADLIRLGTAPLSAAHLPASRSALSPSHPSSTLSTLFPRTLLTFATLLYATHHQHAPLLHTGATLYAQTLRHLNALLAVPETHASDTLLLSIATLAILEYLVPTSPSTPSSASQSPSALRSPSLPQRKPAHLHHMAALNTLLAQRDPTRLLTSPLSIPLYTSVRHMCVFSALAARRSTVFARETWRRVMRDARSGCAEDDAEEEEEGWAVLAEISVLLEAWDGLRARAWEGGGLEQEGEGERRALMGRSEELWVRLGGWGERERSDGNGNGNGVATPTTFLYDTAAIHVCRLLASLAPASTAQNSSATETYLLTERTAALHIQNALPQYVASAQAHMPPIVHWAIIAANETLERGDWKDENR